MNEHTRREFLWRALPGAAVAGAGLTMLRPWVSFAAGVQGPPPAVGGGKRSYVAAKYALEIDGQFAGWIESVEGGHATSGVESGRAGIEQKRGPGVRYEDIRVNCGTGMSRNLYDWIQASFNHQYSRKNGAVIAADYNYNEVERLDWFNGVITEVGFPALDASSKDAAKMTIMISPETTRVSTRTGGRVGGTYKNDQAIQKKWLPSNFRLQIDGLEAACTRVNKIEAIVVGQGRSAGYGARGMAGGLQASNLVITLPEADAKPFYMWLEGVRTEGKGIMGGGRERNGTLAFLTPNLQEALFTLTFRGLSIARLTPEKVEAHSENIRRAKAEMTYQSIAFAHGPAAWG
jgi:phage tail-like protein